MSLYASDGNGHVGSSNSFNVLALPPLALTVPLNTTEGNAPATGTVSIPAALSSDLVVDLASSDTNRLTVPASVTILAGQTSASVPITIDQHRALGRARGRGRHGDGVRIFERQRHG